MSCVYTSADCLRGGVYKETIEINITKLRHPTRREAISWLFTIRGGFKTIMKQYCRWSTAGFVHGTSVCKCLTLTIGHIASSWRFTFLTSFFLWVPWQTREWGMNNEYFICERHIIWFKGCISSDLSQATKARQLIPNSFIYLDQSLLCISWAKPSARHRLCWMIFLNFLDCYSIKCPSHLGLSIVFIEQNQC